MWENAMASFENLCLKCLIFSHLTGIWKITHTAVTFLLFKSVGELPLISVESGLSWYVHKTLTSTFGFNLKSHIPSFFVNLTNAGFKGHFSRVLAVRVYKSCLCNSLANNALATIIENFAFLQFLVFLSLHYIVTLSPTLCSVTFWAPFLSWCICKAFEIWNALERSC